MKAQTKELLKQVTKIFNRRKKVSINVVHEFILNKFEVFIQVTYTGRNNGAYYAKVIYIVDGITIYTGETFKNPSDALEDGIIEFLKLVLKWQ